VELPKIIEKIKTKGRKRRGKGEEEKLKS